MVLGRKELRNDNVSNREAKVEAENNDYSEFQKRLCLKM